MLIRNIFMIILESPREFDTDFIITTELIDNIPQPRFFENLSGKEYEFASG